MNWWAVEELVKDTIVALVGAVLEMTVALELLVATEVVQVELVVFSMHLMEAPE